jgi:hypothetical protein
MRDCTSDRRVCATSCEGKKGKRELTGASETQITLTLKTPRNDVLYGLRDIVEIGREWRVRLLQDLCDELGESSRLECAMSNEDLIEHATERPNVRAMIGLRHAANLLRREVGRRSCIAMTAG